MKNLLLIITIVLSNSAIAQSDTIKKNTLMVETPATFPGGTDSFNLYIATNLEYPEEALDNEVFGNVWVQFDIDREGNVENVQVVKSELKIYTYEDGKKKRFKKKTKVSDLNGGNDYCLENVCCKLNCKFSKVDTSKTTWQKCKNAIQAAYTL